MKQLNILLVFAAFIAFIPCAFCEDLTMTSGTATVSVQTTARLSVHSFDFTSDSGGNVVGVTPRRIFGSIARVSVKSYDTATSPSVGFSVTMLDHDGFDLLTGKGSSIDPSTGKTFVPKLFSGDGQTTVATNVYIGGMVYPRITNMGASRRLIVRLYME